MTALPAVLAVALLGSSVPTPTWILGSWQNGERNSHAKNSSYTTMTFKRDGSYSCSLFLDNKLSAKKVGTFTFENADHVLMIMKKGYSFDAAGRVTSVDKSEGRQGAFVRILDSQLVIRPNEAGSPASFWVRLK